MLWESKLKVGQKHLIWKFQSYVEFCKGLGHDLMNQAHAMHFIIISKKNVLNAKFELMENLFFRASHCHNPNIQIPKNVHQGA